MRPRTGEWSATRTLPPPSLSPAPRKSSRSLGSLPLSDRTIPFIEFESALAAGIPAPQYLPDVARNADCALIGVTAGAFKRPDRVYAPPSPKCGSVNHKKNADADNHGNDQRCHRYRAYHGLCVSVRERRMFVPGELFEC